MAISALKKTAVRLTIPFSTLMLTALTACGLNLAGTDEQENTIAKDPDVNESVDPATGDSYSSSTSFSSSSNDDTPTGSGTVFIPSTNGNNAVDHPGLQDFDITLIPDSIFTLDTLHTAPAYDICTGEYCNIDTRKKIIGTKGTFYYQMWSWEAKVECEANDSQSSSYSVSKYGSTIKEFVSLDEGEVEMFKQDCIAEGGNIGSDIPSNSTTCTLSNADEFYYYDSNWSKYSHIILSHCKTENL